MQRSLEEVDTEDARCRGYRLTKDGHRDVRGADAWLEMIGNDSFDEHPREPRGARADAWLEMIGNDSFDEHPREPRGARADAWLEMIGNDSFSKPTPEELKTFTATLRRIELAVRDEAFPRELRGIAGTGYAPPKRR